ncbi:MAG: hypothetical protein WCY26_03350 [Thiohalobacteraceae bacterium]
MDEETLKPYFNRKGREGARRKTLLPRNLRNLQTGINLKTPIATETHGSTRKALE